MKLKKSIAIVFAALAAAIALTDTAAAQVYTYTEPTASVKTLPDTPASTLLVPYFEVDLGNGSGINTIINLNNIGAQGTLTITYDGESSTYPRDFAPQANLARVVIWSDMGVPVFSFHVYLTGYDVERINMRNVLNGILPQTATAGQDPSATISPKGPLSQDINYQTCSVNNYTAVLPYSVPYLPPGQLTPAQIDNLRRSLTGQSSAQRENKCAGQALNDNIARGYVTIDQVSGCSATLPNEATYAAELAMNSVFTGEVIYVNQASGMARGGNVVHIHSDDGTLEKLAGNLTFYGRLRNFDAADRRQPLPTTFGARYVGGDFMVSSGGKGGKQPNPGSSSLIVWRDSKHKQDYFACGSTPSWYPLAQEQVVAFDEQERVQATTWSPGFESPMPLTTPFPAATQVVKIGGPALPVSFPSGWLYLNLNHTAAPSAMPGQSWVEVIEQSGTGQFNLMHRAQAIDSGIAPSRRGPGKY